jgi:hypothetical protein
MSESFTSTYTCDGCGKAATVEGIADCPPFWLAVSFRTDSNSALSAAHGRGRALDGSAA